MGDKNVMPKVHEDNKQETIRTSPRFTVKQIGVIDKLIGPYGRSRSEVVKTLVVMWLEQNGELQDSGFK